MAKKKYRNKEISIDGVIFDSKKEARRYTELKLLERSGAIQNLELQKEYLLIPAQYEYFERFGKNGRKLKDGKICIEKSCIYKADFVYIEDGKIIVEDVKGFKSPNSAGYAKFVIKRKLMLYQYGIRIKEV